MIDSSYKCLKTGNVNLTSKMIEIEFIKANPIIEPCMTRPEAGTVVLGGLGVGILTPSFNAVISIRVSDKEPFLLPKSRRK